MYDQATSKNVLSSRARITDCIMRARFSVRTNKRLRCYTMQIRALCVSDDGLQEI